MRQMVKADSLLIYFSVSLIFMEVMFRALTAEQFVDFSLVRSLLFLLSFAFIFFLICSFFQGTTSFLLSILFLVIVAIIYSSQFIYFRFFGTYYSVYSAGNGAQIIDFWKDISILLGKNSLWVFLWFLPSIILIFFGRKFLLFERLDWVNKLSLVLCIGLVHLTGIITVYSGGKEQLTAFDLYFQNSYPLVSVERLGLITTMRLDLQRQIVGWSPALEVSQPAESESERSSSNEEVKTKLSKEEQIEYNIMNIDFDQLKANEKSQEIRGMHQYFQSVQPTKKNEYTGKYKGYNLIFITAEGFSPYAVNETLTPTLYKMVHGGFHFTNFYTPLWGVSTSDGEYVACTGLIPKSGVWSFKESSKNYLPFTMGNQLKKLHYKTSAYHDHTYTYYGRDISHPNMGYTFKGVGNGLQVKKTWPESDLEMMEKTIPEYIANVPFHTYYMTVSGHLRYSFTGNYIAWKNRSLVENLPYSEEGQAYMATQIELDKALEYLLNQLEMEGKADRTLIALSADHYPYGLEPKTIDELAGHTVDRNFELYKSTFILYTKGMKPMTIREPASSLDIIPTLSNLLGLEFDSRLLMGKDIFSDSAPLVIFANRSFITDKGGYNSITGKFIVNNHTEMDKDYVKNISSTIQKKFYYSAKLLEMDYYRRIFK